MMNLLKSDFWLKFRRELRSAWLYLLPYVVALVFAAAYLSGLFVRHAVGRLILLLISLPAPIYGLWQRYQQQEQSRRREFCANFFRLLSGNLNAGLAVTPALLSAGREIESIAGRRGRLGTALTHLQVNLGAHAAPAEALRNFGDAIDCHDARPLFYTLAHQINTGQETESLAVRAAELMAARQKLAKDHGAENSRQNMEAGILCALPFVMALAMRSMLPDYFAGAVTDPLGRILMILAWIVAVSALAATIILTVPSATRAATRTGDKQHQGRIKHRRQGLRGEKRRPSVRPRSFISWTDRLAASAPGRLFARLLRYLLPRSYMFSLAAALEETKSSPVETYPFRIRDSREPAPLLRRRQSALERHLASRFSLICFLLPPIILIVLLGTPWYFAPIILLLLLRLDDRRLLARGRDKEQTLIANFPLLLNLTAALLRSGYTVRSALNAAVSALISGQPRSISGAAPEKLRLDLSSGVPTERTLNDLIGAHAFPELRAAANIICQYERTGSEQNITLLELQAETCNRLYMDSLRRRHESRSILLFIPMLLNLAAVMLIVAAPVIVSLNTGLVF
ncbi:MAG: hypothetical protein GX900_05855 [Clostridiaceae bacterium]|nr:hypothetical protein [Clostridiaceae bacterium]